MSLAVLVAHLAFGFIGVLRPECCAYKLLPGSHRLALSPGQHGSEVSDRLPPQEPLAASKAYSSVALRCCQTNEASLTI
jgi:hypothetical protein